MRAQACLTICNSMDCSLPGSSAHRILWARILDRVTISSSRGSSWPQDWTHVSWVSALQANSLPLSHLRSPGCKYQQTRAITRTLFLSIVYVRAALHTTPDFPSVPANYFWTSISETVITFTCIFLSCELHSRIFFYISFEHTLGIESHLGFFF